MELNLSHITKKYGKKTVLSDVSFTLTSGIYALLGPNGAGKTTLMQIITDLLEPTGGAVTWDGKPLRQWGAQYREQLGFLPQDPGFYSFFSGETMMRYFAELKGVSEDSCERLLKLVNLWDERKKKVGKYSGGMRRRLGIAAALLGEPKLLILDEPTAGLDPKERIRFRNLIAQIAENCTVLYSTHIISDIEGIANQVILLRNGTICRISAPEELCSVLEGKVFTMRMNAEESLPYLNQTTVTAYSVQNGQAHLRLIAQSPPHSSAVRAVPNLEDVYLYYFGNEESTDAAK